MFDGFWYRCEIKHYSISDEWGDHCYTTSCVTWTKFAIIRETPKGVWLSGVPLHHHNPDVCRNTDRHFKDFVLGKSMRQLACPTKETALADAIVRKKRHIAGCQARLKSAQNELVLLEREAKTIPPILASQKV